MPARLAFSPDDPRLRRLNDAPVRPGGDFVLYVMQATRRADDNAALAYALGRANELGTACVVVEAVLPHPLATDRSHRFVLEGARDTGARLARRGIAHALFVPRAPADVGPALGPLAVRARLVVVDDSPESAVSASNAALASAAACPVIAVDDCAVVPLALIARSESSARALRPKLKRLLGDWLRPLQEPEPERAPPLLALPFDPVDAGRADLAELVASCAIDHGAPPVDGVRGGSKEAERRLDRFVRGPLDSYAADRNDPTRDGTSGLSAYLRHGMTSARHVALTAAKWCEGPGLDAFLEQLLVRRALCFNFARSLADPSAYAALPPWARATLADRAGPRPGGDVSLADLEAGRSPDPLWNAAMGELRARGTMHGYARMLWGKLPLAWMARPEDAHAAVVALNDRWALDGGDPSGYGAIGWCFGLHDRPWPSRPVFGAVRAMTSASARRKLDFEEYIARWATSRS